MCELSIVIPVYNEASAILKLLGDWSKVFDELNVSYQFIFINDGSFDNSADILRRERKSNNKIVIIDQSNMGHGPAIIKGYRMALPSKWIFQIDGDHQYSPETFIDLWKNREHYDLLIGERVQRNESMARNIISAIARLSVKLLCKDGIKDVNSPYRLMRSAELANAIAVIPSNSFAPNIMISLFFLGKKRRVYIAPIYASGVLSRKSVISGYIMMGSIRSFFQIVKFRMKL